MQKLLLDDDLASAGIGGERIGPSHRDYDKRRKVWNGLTDRRPASIICARDVADVMKTVRVAARTRSAAPARGDGRGGSDALRA